jgi:hypothetical protein
VAQLVQLATPVHIPVEFEGAYVCRCDDTTTRQELGVAPRDLEVTLADSVRWLVAHGHISGRQAGKLATELTTSSCRSESASCQRIGSDGQAGLACRAAGGVHLPGKVRDAERHCPTSEYVARALAYDTSPGAQTVQCA